MIEDTIALAEARWHLEFKRKNANEASAPCPFCGTGIDRFLIFDDTRRYWCRQCDANGFIVDRNDLSDIEKRLLDVENRQREIEKRQAEQQAQIDAIKALVSAQDHILYHQALNDYARDYWHSQGINDASIDRFLLGFCRETPLYPSRQSFTIPVINQGKLRNIRHRMDCDRDPRYLPHLKHLPRTMFNADRILTPGEWIVIVEGEKKAICLEQHGFPSTAVFGINGFDTEWSKWFRHFSDIYVCYDADAVDKGAEIAGLFDGKGHVIELPEGVCKPDDYFLQGGTVNGFAELMRKAKIAS